MENDRKLGKELPRLTEDLIVEILVKLPVDSLLRFRCVCKLWYDLIKNPNFIQRHMKHSSTKIDSILVTRAIGVWVYIMSIHSYESLNLMSSVEMEIPELEQYRLKVCEPCNGLVCIADWETNIVLFNPALREFKILPPRDFPSRKRWVKLVDGIGFGFDCVTNDYKVVSFVRLCRKDEDEISDESDEDYESDEDDEYDGYDTVEEVGIYDLSTNSWREIEHVHDLPRTDDAPVSSAPFNGALHWIAWSRGKGSNIILCFDLSTEVFRDMELPNDPLVKREEKEKFLTVLNGSFALFAYSRHTSSEQFVELWVMHEYGDAKSWMKQVSIGPMTGIQRPLLLWKNEAILLRSEEGRLVSYALDTHEMNDFEASLLESKDGRPVPCAPDIHEMDEFGLNSNPGMIGLMVYQESLISIV